MIDFVRMRRNMVESQVQPNDVTDRRILRAMLEVPRERFVAPAMADLAYIDEAVPMEATVPARDARRMGSPLVISKLLQLAAIAANDLVLEVGCGSGYLTAVIARLAMTVVGVESNKGLADRARKTLADLSVDNANVIDAPLAEGCAAEGPFDVIIFGGCVPEVPDTFRQQLKLSGRLVAVVGESRHAQAMLFERAGQGWSSRPVFNAAAPALPGFEKAPAFLF